jgi:hypothetical protein
VSAKCRSILPVADAGLLTGFDLLTLSQQLQERRPGSHHWQIIAKRRTESAI